MEISPEASHFAQPDRVIIFTQAAVALHNYLRTVESSVYCPPGFVDSEDGCGNVVDGGWRSDEDSMGMQSISHTGSNRYTEYFFNSLHLLLFNDWQIFTNSCTNKGDV